MDDLIHKIEPFKDQYRITVIHTFGFWWFKSRLPMRYVGNRTVWHEYPSGRRAGSGLERWLCDSLTAWQWRENPRKVTDIRSGAASKDGIDLLPHWGGAQLHIVEME